MDYQQPVTLPYIQGTTFRIDRILQKHNIKTAFTLQTTVASLLRSPKVKYTWNNKPV